MEIGRLIDTVLCISITREEEILISLVGINNFSWIRAAHSVTKTSFLGNSSLKIPVCISRLLYVTFPVKIIKTCRGSLRFYFILVIFPFQIAPLIVIVSTASLGAIAFGIRQATKNPEAWYVNSVFIKPEKKCHSRKHN